MINARQRSQKRASTDEFASLLDRSKNDKALHNLQWTPAPRVVYFIDEQVEDIIQECCVSNFYVTRTMYQGEKVISKKTAKPANLPGPAMFHTTKTQRDYLYFAHTLLESNYALERIAFVDGDRDKAQSFFLKPLKGCTFLP